MAKKIKVTLSDARPVSIDPAKWPVIAEASWHEGQYEFQAFRKAYLRVRESEADGRRVVYGWTDSSYPTERDIYAGYMLDSLDESSETALDEATVRAIRRVAGAIGHEELGSECIGDLPERVLDEDVATDVAAGLDEAERGDTVTLTRAEVEAWGATGELPPVIREFLSKALAAAQVSS